MNNLQTLSNVKSQAHWQFAITFKPEEITLLYKYVTQS